MCYRIFPDKYSQIIQQESATLCSILSSTLEGQKWVRVPDPAETKHMQMCTYFFFNRSFFMQSFRHTTPPLYLVWALWLSWGFEESSGILSSPPSVDQWIIKKNKWKAASSWCLVWCPKNDLTSPWRFSPRANLRVTPVERPAGPPTPERTPQTTPILIR